MASDDDIGLLRALGFVAWADDRLAPEERQMLGMVMDALAIPEERRRELCEAMRRAPPTLDEIRDSFTDDTERRFAVAQAILIAQADGELVAAERRDIARLAEALGIDDEELTQIYAAVDVTNSVAAGMD